MYEPARDGPRRSGLILRPLSRVGGHCFPPQTMTACHTCVAPRPGKPRQSCAPSNRGLVRSTHANARGLHFKLSPALARAHRQNRGKAMTETEAVAFVETKRRARALRRARPYLASRP